MARALRVALFTDTAMLRIGAEVRPLRDQFVHFVRHLAAEDLQLTIVARTTDAPTLDSPIAPVETSDDLRFVDLPFYRNTEDYYRRLVPLTMRSWPTILREVRRADLVLLRVHHCAAPLVWWAARRTGTPFAMYWAGPPISRSAAENYRDAGAKGFVAVRLARLEEAFVRRIAPRAFQHFFIDVNEYALMGSPEPTVFVVPTLVSARDLDNPPPATSDAVVQVSFVGRIVRHKGVFDIVDAAEALLDSGLSFEVVFLGDGEALEELRRRVRESPHRSAFDVRGGVSREVVAEGLARSDIFCLPSRAEGVPKVLWEAWAGGNAVVISDSGSTRQHVRDGENGQLIPAAGDGVALKAALASVIADRDLRERLSSAGRETARGHTREQTIAVIRDHLLAFEVDADRV